MKEITELIDLSDLTCEALTALDKVNVMNNELANFFGLKDKNFILHEFSVREIEQWIMSDYLTLLLSKLNELHDKLNDILECKGG